MSRTRGAYRYGTKVKFILLKTSDRCELVVRGLPLA
eukprot:SAG31_NODE_4768_length_2967_cov_4.361227_2_plen_36_part_00